MADDVDDLADLLARATAGDLQSWESLLVRCSDRLRRLIRIRLDVRLQARLDPADILQKVLLQASAHRAEYLRKPLLPFYLWLRSIAIRQVLMAHRRHLGTEMRAIDREVVLDDAALAGDRPVEGVYLVSREIAPDELAARNEQRGCLWTALDQLAPVDREILLLRHFEQLTRAETAKVLNIKETTAGKRYWRALQRLRALLR